MSIFFFFLEIIFVSLSFSISSLYRVYYYYTTHIYISYTCLVARARNYHASHYTRAYTTGNLSSRELFYTTIINKKKKLFPTFIIHVQNKKKKLYLLSLDSLILLYSILKFSIKFPLNLALSALSQLLLCRLLYCLFCFQLGDRRL